VHACLETEVGIDKKVVETDRDVDLVQVNLSKVESADWPTTQVEALTSWESVERVSTWKRDVCDVAIILGPG
jgi:hypothetical protein